MKFTLPKAILLSTCFLAGCKKTGDDKSRREKDLGFKAIPAGEKPARAPGPKGLMINMDDKEVRILVVPPGSPAHLAGFQAGDVIVAADGKEVSNEDQLANAIDSSATKKIFLEVRRKRKLLTLPLASRDPGWIVLSGDTFKGFLLTRAQSSRKIDDLPVGQKAPDLNLPVFGGPSKPLPGKRPLALLFWGTFLEPSYTHLQAFAKACKDRDIDCVAIDTMELFTAVGKTREFQAELEKVQKTLWPDRPIPIDLFLESERKFGVKKLPTLILVDAQGIITARFDGPLSDPEKEISRAIDDLAPDRARSAGAQ